jgi:hypothetical protein
MKEIMLKEPTQQQENFHNLSVVGFHFFHSPCFAHLTLAPPEKPPTPATMMSLLILATEIKDQQKGIETFFQLLVVYFTFFSVGFQNAIVFEVPIRILF